MARTSEILANVTSNTGASVSTPTVNCSPFESVVFWFIGAGAAAPTGCSVTLFAPDGTSLGSGAVTVAIGGKSPAVIGPSPASGVTNAVALGPVSGKASATGTGGASSTVQIIAVAVRDGAPAN